MTWALTVVVLISNGILFSPIVDAPHRTLVACGEAGSKARQEWLDRGYIAAAYFCNPKAVRPEFK